jgi:Rod binding domain-containing protein
MSDVGLQFSGSAQSSGIAQTDQTKAVSALPPSPRLVSAAHEFEAAMMKELMAPLTPGHDLSGGDEDRDSSSALDSFAGEALGKAISEHGGFGIAKAILHQLSTGSNHSGKTAVPLSSNGTPSNSPSKLLQ